MLFGALTPFWLTLDLMLLGSSVMLLIAALTGMGTQLHFAFERMVVVVASFRR